MGPPLHTDPTLAKIVAPFRRFDIQQNRGAYMIVEGRTANPIARLRPLRTPIASNSNRVAGRPLQHVGP
jgi:hypothetical protein